jgi:hypothetical protein
MAAHQAATSLLLCRATRHRTTIQQELGGCDSSALAGGVFIVRSLYLGAVCVAATTLTNTLVMLSERGAVRVLAVL